MAKRQLGRKLFARKVEPPLDVSRHAAERLSVHIGERATHPCIAMTTFGASELSIGAVDCYSDVKEFSRRDIMHITENGERVREFFHLIALNTSVTAASIFSLT